LRFRPEGVPGWAIWLAFSLKRLLYALTAIWWDPLMARLSTPTTGLVLPLYRRLMLNHWLRVAIVTAYGILAFWMVNRTLQMAKLDTSIFWILTNQRVKLRLVPNDSGNRIFSVS